MGKTLIFVVGEVRSIRENLVSRDKMERQAQILLAEVSAARDVAEAAKKEAAAAAAADASAWTSAKTRALYVLVFVCLVSSYPGLASMVQKMKGFIP